MKTIEKVPQLHLEEFNYLQAIDSVGFTSFEWSRKNILTNFDHRTFIISSEVNNNLLLSAYSQPPNSTKAGGIATVYELVNEKRLNEHVCVHQAFFKLSGDGDLRKLSFDAWQIEEIVTTRKDIVDSVQSDNRNGDVFFLLESGNYVYPISVSPHPTVTDMYQVRLKDFGDLTLYAGHKERFVIPF